MTRSELFKDSVRARIADHLEAAIAIAGVTLALAATAGVMMGSVSRVAILGVVWLEGLLLVALHRRSRTDRERLVQQLRVMLQDRVNNQLTVLVGLTDIRAQSTASGEHDDGEIALTAARAVSREIETLSIESLRSWEARFSKHLPAQLR